MSIELHIERLVIDEGLLGAERAGSVQAMIERALAQSLTQPGAVVGLRRLGSRAALPPALLPAATHANDRLGPRVAVAVGQSLGIPSVVRDRSAGSHD